MPLVEANYQTQPGYPSWMPLAEAKSSNHLGHPLRISLAEANHQFIPAIHLGCH
jgi:hypothetical protein